MILRGGELLQKYQFGRLLLFEKLQYYFDHLTEQLGSFYPLPQIQCS